MNLSEALRAWLDCLFGLWGSLIWTGVLTRWGRLGLVGCSRGRQAVMRGPFSLGTTGSCLQEAHRHGQHGRRGLLLLLECRVSQRDASVAGRPYVAPGPSHCRPRRYDPFAWKPTQRTSVLRPGVLATAQVSPRPAGAGRMVSISSGSIVREVEPTATSLRDRQPR